MGSTPEKRTKVSVIKAANRRDAVRRSIEILGVNPVLEKEVVLKPNFNTADPFPGSTHPDTLRELILCLREMGATQVTIGERSGPVNTAEVMEKLGVFQLAEELGVEVVNFDQLTPKQLVKVDAPGSHWKNGFLVPRLLREAECVVATACLKTHQYGGIFTMALKLAVGIVPKEGTTFMKELHGSPNMRKMISELNVAYRPDLIVLDCMEGFVDGGPMKGTSKPAGLFLAGTDRIAVDAVGVAILKELGSTPEIMNSRIFDQEQIVRAAELGLGITSPAQIELVADDFESAAYAQKIRLILNQG